jgi:hypothetical protein
MASVTTADEARMVWILTPANAPGELDAWRAAYEAAVPRPDGSVLLPVIWA